MNRKPKANKQLGEKGEQLACEYLIKRGYQILEQNFRYKHLEIDIIAQDTKEKEIVFVEVKLRSNNQFGSPALAVDQRKIARLTKVAQIYYNQKRLNSRFRFDIISILPGKIEQYKNVTAEW